LTGLPEKDSELLSIGGTVARKAMIGQPVHDIEWVSSEKKTVGRKAVTGQHVMTVSVYALAEQLEGQGSLL
jgi:hypothetical protein